MQRSLSTQVFIGIILLAGYVVNAAIILVDHFTHMDPQKSLEERLVEAGSDRLRPILMTVCSTVLGFFPMALSFGQASDLWAPLAITVIGGLIGSTFLTLFILPAYIVCIKRTHLKGIFIILWFVFLPGAVLYDWFVETFILKPKGPLPA